MRRDFDLIRLLLQEIEGVEDVSDLSKYTKDQQLYHSCLLIEAGLVHGAIVADQNGDPASTRISRLTWSGHEFLDLTRNNTVWAQAKGLLKESARAATIEILTSACRQLISLTVEATIRGLAWPK